MRPMFITLCAFVALVAGYVYYAALRCARLLLPGRRRLCSAAAALALLLAPCLICFILFDSVIAVLLLIALLALMLAAEQLVHTFIEHMLRRRSRAGCKWALRDKLHRSGLIALLCVAVMFVYGYFNMHNIVRTQYVVETTKSIPGGELKLALLSDLHYGAVLKEDGVRALVERLSAEEPDLLLLCGDILDESTMREGMQRVFELLSRVPTRYGIYYVYGNHDRSGYQPQHAIPRQEIEAMLEDVGITLLCDTSVRPGERLLLVGREDRYRPRKGIAELLTDADADDFVLLLDHQPTGFQENADAGVDLMLSGHTHGGQIFPAGYINTLISDNELCYGSTQCVGKDGGKMTAIVSSGAAGWGIPLRTQEHSEYVIITVKHT